MNDNLNLSYQSSGLLYDVKHLATFTVGSKGLLRPEDGMKKLRSMEKSIGLWAMDCQLVVDVDILVILDKKTGQEIETVQLSLIQEPTSVIIDDKKNLYNNLLLFTVLQDPKIRNSPTEMHIFHCVKTHSTEIVDEIVLAKESLDKNTSRQEPRSYTRRYLNNSMESSSKAEHRNHTAKADLSGAYSDNSKKASHQKALYAINSSSNKAYSPLSTSLDEDVRILNHCFDDIEHFVSRLLNVSAYSREIERRQKKYKLRKTQLSTADMGMLSIRAKVPSQQSFYDIFQKFKLSFNLLAHLKAHIHDPNAPELVHFLFTPLKLVINATKDSHTLRGLTKTVWSPLLTREAKELLLNCLTSREQDLWQSCGEAWYISKDEARVLHNLMFFEPYNPIFYDGWSPTIENSDTRSEVSRIAVLAAQQQASLLQAQNSSPNSSRKQRRQHSAQPSNREHHHVGKTSLSQLSDEIKNWVITVQQAGGKVYESLADRKANNDKELTLRAGELVEVLDDTRNWWRLKNMFGDIGHAPNTILQPFISINLNNYSTHQLSVEKVGYF